MPTTLYTREGTKRIVPESQVSYLTGERGFTTAPPVAPTVPKPVTGTPFVQPQGTDPMRPITQAPVSNTSIQAPAPVENPLISSFSKILKQQYGSLLSDDEYKTIAQNQIESKQKSLEQNKSGTDAIIAEIRKQREQADAQTKQKEMDLANKREVDTTKYEISQKAAYAPEKERYMKSFDENLATSERLLGSQGRLTSSIGQQNYERLGQQRDDALSAVDARIQAQVELYRAQQEGKDEATINQMIQGVQALQQQENKAMLEAEANLQALKQSAAEAGNQSLLDLLKSAADNLTSKKAQSNFSQAATEAVNDGFIRDASGQKILDTDGKPIQYKPAVDNKLIEVSAGASIYDPSTGTIVATAPVKGKVSTASSGGDFSSDFSGGFTSYSPATTQPVTPKVSFGEFLAKKQEEAGMSFNAKKVAELKKEYDSINVQPTIKSTEADISKYSPPVQDVIRGVISAESLYSVGTAGERKKYISEINDARKKGLLKQAPSEKQKAVFNTIVDKYNKSPLIAAADRTVVLKNTIDQIKKDPGNGTLQLNLVYSYIQALDTYQSAVREGELGLVNSIDSTFGQLKNTIDKMKNGQIVRPEVAKKVADAAQNVLDTISEGAKNKERAFSSQARVNGIEDLWKDYLGGFVSSFESVPGISNKTPGGITYTIEE